MSATRNLVKSGGRVHHHAMPFGCTPLPEGGVRFCLWAPGAEDVELCLFSKSREPIFSAMKAISGGWFQQENMSAAAGDLYQFRVNGNFLVPDPASRFQPDDIYGPSQIISAQGFDWQDSSWQGRPWEEVILYELHVGTFSPEGTFAGVETRLDYLVDLGITAIELMPVADFPGKFNWGYDGVLLFAPDSVYGHPDDLKRLVCSAHQKGLMVFLDVVYNHFGPEGNYLHVYAREAFFQQDLHTPWGAAINFSRAGSRTVRDFFIHNALYWLEEFQLDGLRFDAVHGIHDDSHPHILEEIAQAVAKGPGRERHIHLVLENDGNEARYLQRNRQGAPMYYTAQWNDDIHHALHVLITGEEEGYYRDYVGTPAYHLGRCLTEGFAYQGEPSRYRNGRPRGESSRMLPPTAFVSFLQNHDQVGRCFPPVFQQN
jgi:maltooligosyltrehalose trehalohydrolase